MKDYPAVKLGRVTLPVRFDESLERSGRAGEMSMSNREIVLLPGMVEQEQAETLLHEILHAVSHRCGAKLSEKQVLRLEVGLSDFIAQNLPLIVRLSKELQ